MIKNWSTVLSENMILTFLVWIFALLLISVHFIHFFRIYIGSTPDLADPHRILQIYTGPTSDHHRISMIAMITMISMIFTGSPLIYTDLHDLHGSVPLNVTLSNERPAQWTHIYFWLIFQKSETTMFLGKIFPILIIEDFFLQLLNY